MERIIIYAEMIKKFPVSAGVSLQDANINERQLFLNKKNMSIKGHRIYQVLYLVFKPSLLSYKSVTQTTVLCSFLFFLPSYSCTQHLKIK